MSLFITLTFLTFLNAFASRIASLLLKLISDDSDIKSLSESINELKKELNTISMVNEFAKYARVQRKLNKLVDDRKELAKTNTFKLGKIKYGLIFSIYILSTILLVILVWMNRSQVVAKVPSTWLWPIASFFNWFNDIPGSITAPCWVVISSSVSKTLSNYF